MFFSGKKGKQLLALGLAFVLAASPVQSLMQSASVVHAAETEEVTLQSVRNEAAAKYTSDQTGFDLDLSGETFDGSKSLDYSSQGNYLQVFNNLRQGEEDQTIIIRFRATDVGLLFGVGSTLGDDNGKNVTFGIANGNNLTQALRLILRNTNSGINASKSGLKGFFSSNLADGNYHTIAVSMLPSLGYTSAGNARLVIDGSGDVWVKSWGGSWKAGLNQSPNDAFQYFQIGGGGYVNSDNCANKSLNGAIDFITVINKAYTVEELQEITAPPENMNDFGIMTTAGTSHSWLFTGGTETVADFATSKTTRNYVGLFEDNLRSGGTYIERSHFVFNTAKRGADVARLAADYDTLIAPYKTKAVVVMVGESDYSKGSAGVETFKTNLTALLEKLYEAGKHPILLTPYPSVNQADASNITLYKDAINAVAAGKGTKVIDLSSISSSMVGEGHTLTPAGHQAVANAIKTALGYNAGNRNYVTSFSFNSLSDGSYTVAKKAEDGTQCALEQVTAADGSLKVKVAADTLGSANAALEYVLTDESGQKISGSAPAGATEFTVGGLVSGKAYTVSVYDTSRGTVKEAYLPVKVSAETGAVSEPAPEDGNLAVNDKIQALLKSETPVTYLFMGDSITHGIVTQGYDNVPQMFAKYLDELGRTEDVVLNTGVSNATLSTTLDQVDHRLMKYNPDVVMIMLGTNDSSTRGEMVNGDTNDVQGFKNRYKALVRKIHENNENSSIVLRVPCDMIVDQPHSQYETYFASIYDVAEEMRTEIPGLNIVVVDHMKEWRNYRDTVRNDNIRNTGTYNWLVDNVHPNGRGNMSMFQQIIKELGLYVETSEMANFAYAVGDWTASSQIQGSVVKAGNVAILSMDSLASYTNGLREVTLTLTDANGVSFSRTAAYESGKNVEVNNLPDGTYTASVTGKDRTNSKLVSFAASMTEEQGCLCALGGIKLDDQQIELDATEEPKTITLAPEAEVKTNGCTIHTTNTVTYRYEVTEGNGTVATVSAEGVVTALAPGKAKIRVTAEMPRKEGMDPATETKTITLTVTSNKATDEDKAAIQAAVTAAMEGLKAEDYTEVTWKALQDAIAAAQAVAAKENAGKEEVTAAVEAITRAREALVKKQDANLEEQAEAEALKKAKEEMQTAMATSKVIVDAGQKDYTKASWDAFVAAYNALKNAPANADSKTLNGLLAELAKAKGALKKADGGSTTPIENKLAAPVIKRLKSGAGKKNIFIKITVGEVEGADAYEIYRVAGGKETLVGKTKSGSKVLKDKKITKKSVQYYAVAVSKDGKVKSSKGISKKITLNKTTTIKSVKRSGNKIRLTWKKIKNAKNYAIYRSEKKKSGYRRVATVAKSRTSWADKNVKKGKTYYYRIAVRGKNTVSLMSKMKKIKR